jgi:hypothetical protein
VLVTSHAKKPITHHLQNIICRTVLTIAYNNIPVSKYSTFVARTSSKITSPKEEEAVVVVPRFVCNSCVS